MRTQTGNVTELPASPEDERRSRMIKYSVAMIVRMICIGLCVVVHGWWLLLPVLGAVVLPYFAVVIANAVTRPEVRVVERPGGLVPIDVPSTRRDTSA